MKTAVPLGEYNFSFHIRHGDRGADVTGKVMPNGKISATVLKGNQTTNFCTSAIATKYLQSIRKR
jgi:hypothetical protein